MENKKENVKTENSNLPISDVMQRFNVKFWIGKGYNKKGNKIIIAKNKNNAYDIFCNKYDYFTYLYDPYEITDV